MSIYQIFSRFLTALFPRTGSNSPQELNVNKFYKTFEELSDLEEFKDTTIESLVYIDGDQQAGLFKRNGLTIRTYLAKHFISEKYSNYVPELGKESGKEVLKESTNKLNTANGVNGTNACGGPLVNGSLNGAVLNGTTNGSSNGQLNGAQATNGQVTNGQVTNGQTLTNGNGLNGHDELDCADENEKPKSNALNGTQSAKKPRLQADTDKVSVIDKLGIYVDTDAPCALFFTSVSDFVANFGKLYHPETFIELTNH